MQSELWAATRTQYEAPARNPTYSDEGTAVGRYGSRLRQRFCSDGLYARQHLGLKFDFDFVAAGMFPFYGIGPGTTGIDSDGSTSDSIANSKSKAGGGEAARYEIKASNTRSAPNAQGKSKGEPPRFATQFIAVVTTSPQARHSRLTVG